MPHQPQFEKLATRGKSRNQALKALADLIDIAQVPDTHLTITTYKEPGDPDASPFIAHTTVPIQQP